MTNSFRFITAMVLFILLNIQCKKKEDAITNNPIIPAATKGTVQMNVRAYSGTSPLVYGNTYTNANNDQFKVSLFRYYLSNIVLLGDSSTPDYVQPESYHLVDHGSAGAGYLIKLDSVPNGTYKGVKFLIGVDSLRNVSGAQSGALDPGNEMFWTWSSGYIQFKLEGTTISTAANFMYHIGGYKGIYSAVKEVTILFPASKLQMAGLTKKLYLDSDVQEVFKNPVVWEIDAIRNVSSEGTTAKTIADNYADMIRFNSITN